MPRMDGTGPEGKGSATGRGLGKCRDRKKVDEWQNLGKGMGRRRRSGEGEGRGNRAASGLQES